MVGAVAEPPAPSFFTVALAAVPGCFSTRTSVVFVVIFSSVIAALLPVKVVQLTTRDLVSLLSPLPSTFLLFIHHPINSHYDAVITTTYWYAAAPRAIVKSVSHNPYLGVSTVDLVGVQMRP